MQSHCWTFSPSSELLLQQCVELAGQSDNKWRRAFLGAVPTNSTPLPVVMDISEECSERLNQSKVEAASSCDELIKSLCETIEHDLCEKFPYVQHECKDAKIWQQLAANLSKNALDRLLTYLFDNPNNIEEDFVRNCLCYTLPIVLSTENSWYCIDLLKKAWEWYKTQFLNTVLLLMIKDTAIPPNILHDFLQTVTDEERKLIFTEIVEIKLSYEEFQHHMNTIHLLYKGTEEDILANTYILTHLQMFHEKCSSDKNFGRLLLLYLQRVRTPPSELENIVECHKSAFKRPCLVAYTKVK